MTTPTDTLRINGKPFAEQGDICAVEASDRVGMWDVTMYHPDGSSFVLCSVSERGRPGAELLAAVVATTVTEWATEATR